MGGKTLSAIMFASLAGTAVGVMAQLPQATDDGPILDNIARRAPRSATTANPQTVSTTVFAVTDFRVPAAPGGGGFTARSALAADTGMIPARFAPYPMPITGAAFAYIIRGSSSPIPPMAIRIRIFDDFDLSTTSTSTPFYSQLLGQAVFPNNDPQANNPGQGGSVGLYEFDPLDFPTGESILLDDPSFVYDITCLLESPAGVPTTSQHPTVDPIVRNGVAPEIGTSDPRAWGDLDPPTSSGTNFRSRAFGFATIDSVFRTTPLSPGAHVYVKFEADVGPPPPPDAIDLGTLSSDCTSTVVAQATAQLVPGVPTYYSFVVSERGVTVDGRTFLDIVANPTDAVPLLTAALFNADGVRVALADSFVNSPRHLTFGAARRSPASSSANDFDGRHGDLPPGRYYLTLESLSLANPSTISLTITSTLRGSNPCPLPTPVAPTATDLGTLTPGQTRTVSVTGAGNLTVQWFTFTLPFDICPGNTAFLDINHNGTVFGPTDLALYNAAGVAVSPTYFDPPQGPAGTDAPRSGANGNAQLSFGLASAPRPGDPGTPAGLPYAGQNGSRLKAGQVYYLAVALNETSFEPHGWQARSDSGSNVSMTVNLRLSGTPTGSCPSCPVDHNDDGVLNQHDLAGYLTTFLTEPAAPGPTGTSAFPCPGQADPYSILGFAADYNRDCHFDQEDLIGFITDYFGETENPVRCLPG